MPLLFAIKWDIELWTNFLFSEGSFMTMLEERFEGAPVKSRKTLIKTILILLLAVIVVSAMIITGAEDPAVHTPPSESGQATPEDPTQNGEDMRIAGALSPTDVVTGLMRAVRDWDMVAAARLMPPEHGGIFFETYRDVLAPFVFRLEFDANVERITGSHAIVEVSVYAVDLQSAFGDLSEDAANYLLHRELANSDPSWPEFLAHHTLAIEDIPSLIRMKRIAPVHLVLDENGNWMFDAQNPENESFYNAIGGGVFDLIERLAQIEAAEE